ncbi:hypothetical protein [Polluticaenibacter yanchengensis]|uniref:N-acetyltransferase domain-containing protein n=1 Tax=Polluticaenibacter yanchengensis TaxID=3014562 RepID=A0ABT4UHS7_9BACT|nr:hypothetical protein [Chitinophagaceae bacterium LY-5]
MCGIPFEDLTFKVADIDDFESVKELYKHYYPANHPLFNETFWRWQYLDKPDSGALIICHDGIVYGHMGFVKDGGIVWLINIYIQKEIRSDKVTDELFRLARIRGPIAVVLANPNGKGLLAKKQWYGYEHLKRLIKMNPAVEGQPVEQLLSEGTEQNFDKAEGYYWQQPHIAGGKTVGGEVIYQKPVNGFRLVSATDIAALESDAWERGINWIDAVLMWNDPLYHQLKKAGWAELDYFPWFLNPVDLNRKIDLNLYSEEPLPKGFRFSRIFADMSRIGSIKS